MNIIKMIGDLPQDKFISFLKNIYSVGASDYSSYGSTGLPYGSKLETQLISETMKFLGIDLFKDLFKEE